MKRFPSLTKLFILMFPVFFNAISYAAEVEPKWLTKLDYRQRLIFNQCPSVFENDGQVEGTKVKRVFDYYAKDANTLHWKKLVEGAHFTAGVRQGKYGNAGSLEGDLDYVLRHFPNHPQALFVMGKLQAGDQFNPRKGSRKDYFYWSIDCYLKRAIEMGNNYPDTYLVAAILTHRKKEYETAESNYLKSISLSEESIEAKYNLGLLYFDMSQYDKAKKYAKEAYQAGYPLQGLKQKLKSKNNW